MSAPISLPAAFIRFRAYGAFFAVADRLQPLRRNSQLHEKIARGTGAPVAQPEVIFGGTAFVTMPLDVNAGVGEIGDDAFQRIRVGSESGPRIVTNIVGIVVIERI